LETKKVKEAGAMEQVITLSLVDWMFAMVAGEFSEGECNGQKEWNTLVRDLHTKQADPIYFFGCLLANLLWHY